MIIIKAGWLKKLNTLAFTFYPFIFVRDEEVKKNKYTMNHEKIHARQQLEMLLIFFYLWYYIEYALRALRLGWGKAYDEISFEREAYTNERDLSYLKRRKLFSWTKFL